MGGSPLDSSGALTAPVVRGGVQNRIFSCGVSVDTFVDDTALKVSSYMSRTVAPGDGDPLIKIKSANFPLAFSNFNVGN